MEDALLTLDNGARVQETIPMENPATETHIAQLRWLVSLLAT